MPQLMPPLPLDPVDPLDPLDPVDPLMCPEIVIFVKLSSISDFGTLRCNVFSTFSGTSRTVRSLLRQFPAMAVQISFQKQAFRVRGP